MSASLADEHVAWAVRVLLGRDPCPGEVRDLQRRCATVAELHDELVATDEYAHVHPELAGACQPALVLKEIEPGVRIVIDLSDHAIGVPIAHGRFELNELDYVRSFVRPGMHVVDAGAHAGLYTMTMAARVGARGTVHAFEPDGRLADLLEAGVRENRFHDRATIERAALAAVSGRAALVSPARTHAPGSAWLSQTPEGLARADAVVVRTVALDEYALPHPVSFIKLDVEGSEALAIRGASRVIARDRPAVLCELNPSQIHRVSDTTATSVIESLAALGYECRVLGAGHPGERITSLDRDGSVSVVFTPPGREP